MGDKAQLSASMRPHIGCSHAYAPQLTTHHLQPRHCSIIKPVHHFTGGLRLRATTTHSCRTRLRRVANAQADSQAVSPALARIPTLLTLGRVVAIPALIAAWWSPAAMAAASCTYLFIVAAVTDFLDGYLARKWKVTSAFGAFLDPVADKLMVATVLVLLATQPVAAGRWGGNVCLMPLSAIVMISREITMSAIREWAAALGDEARGATAVSWTGKWKTATQMASLTLLLFARQASSAVQAAWAADAGCVLLGLAVALTVWSLVEYTRALAKYF